MLLALLVDREPFKGKVAPGAELRLHGACVEDWRLHVQLGHSVLDHAELERDHAGHLDCAAEGDLAVALREVEVSDGELGAWDVHGEIHLGATGEVLDVAVSAVFGAALEELSGFDYCTDSLWKHTGIVRAPSLATLLLVASSALPAWVFRGSGGCATIRSATVLAAISSPSRLFHSASTSVEGAHPKMPG